MNMTKESQILEEHQEIFKRFVYFLPPDNYTDLPESILNFLIKHVFFINEALNSDELGQHIKTHFHLEFETEEIERSLRILIQSGLIIKRGNKLFLDIGERKKLEEYCDINGQHKNEFYDEIRKKFIEQDPTFGSNELDILSEDFDKYLNSLFMKVGAEAVHFLYPDENKLRKVLDSHEGQMAFSVLSKRSEHIDKFRKLQFPLVLKHISPQNKVYLSDKLNAVFVYMLVSIDPQCSAYLQKTLEGYSLFLDTNFIYNLLGLDGEELENSAKKLLEIAQKFNFKLFITLRTLEEFNTSLLNAETFLRNYSLPTKDPELLRAGASVLEEAFIKAY